MSELLGGGSGKNGFDVTGGGGTQNAPWTWGVSPFDLGAINTATGQNVQATENRYNQLGLGGSTMEGQDVTAAQDMGQAMIGQEQTANVGNPALNPALQPQINQQIGTGNSNSSLGSLATSVGQAAGAGTSSDTVAT
jgi:hypothetical protein